MKFVKILCEEKTKNQVNAINTLVSRIIYCVLFPINMQFNIYMVHNSELSKKSVNL